MTWGVSMDSLLLSKKLDSKTSFKPLEKLAPNTSSTDLYVKRVKNTRQASKSKKKLTDTQLQSIFQKE